MCTSGMCLLLLLLIYETKDCISQNDEPSIDYFGMSMPYCNSRFCENRCQDETMKPTIPNDDTTNCFCDSVCILYGDCCPDYYTACLNDSIKPIPVQPGNYQWVANRVKALSRNSSKFKLSMMIFMHRMCINLKAINMKRPEPIWLIAECPRSYKDYSVSFKCHNPEADVAGTIPATHKTHKFVNFRNIFCAVCHGVSVGDLRVWNTSLSCVKHINKIDISFDTLPGFLRSRNCSLTVQPLETSELRYCHISDIRDHVFSKRNSKDFVKNLHGTFLRGTPTSKLIHMKTKNQTRNVNTSTKTLLELCGSYRYVVATSCKHISRNVHCNQLENNTTSLEQYKCRPCPMFRLKPPVYVSLSVMFAFDVHNVALCISPSSCSNHEHITCQIDEVYDYYLNKCQPLVCPLGKSPVNGSCTINTTAERLLQHQIFPDGFQVINVNITFYHDNCTFHKTQLLEILLSSFQNKLVDIYSGKKKPAAFPDTVKANSKNRQETKQLSLAVISSCLRDGLKISNSTIHSFIYFSEFLNVLIKVLSGSNSEATISTFPYEDIFCKNNTHEANQNGVLVGRNETLFVYHDMLYYPLENVPFIIKLGVNASVASLVRYFICEVDTHLLDCPMISYPINMTESQNESLHIINTDLYFPLESVAFDDNEVYVCSNFSRSYSRNTIVQFFKFNQIQGLLTLVCSLVSIFSLALVLIIYLLLPDLHNIPGKIVMSVSFFLMTSQSLLLVSNKATGIICKVLGIVLHWTWLSTFIWMTIMGTDLVKTFTGNYIARYNKHSFVLYAMIAVVVPAIFVASCAAVDMATYPNMVIGYGDNGVCWISNNKASLFVFGVPLAVLLLINVVCFIVTICAIQKSMNISKMATSVRKDKIKCIIYSKLLIITGFTWAIGFAASFLKIEPLWYGFIVLNCSQGLYILFCFVVNRRVLRLLKIKLVKHKRDDELGNESRTWSTRM